MPRELARPGHPAPGRPRERDYEIKVVTLPCEPHEYQQYYWHLYYKGVKVNGGIGDYPVEVRERAVRYKYEHHRSLWLTRYVWDEESAGWISKENIVV